jgi:hypothetical protein
MSLQLRLFGGGQPTAGKISASNDGSHAIDKSKVLAQTDAGVITPKTPGNFSSIRSVPVVPDPRYFDREQADALKSLAKEKTDGARQSKRAYKSLAKIEAADKTVHKEHRKYEVPLLKMSWARSAPMLGWLRNCTLCALVTRALDWGLTKLTPTPGLGLMRLKPS